MILVKKWIVLRRLLRVFPFPDSQIISEKSANFLFLTVYENIWQKNVQLADCTSRGQAIR